MILKNLDFLSPHITLFYYNRRRHSSFIGGILTLLMIILSIYIIIQYSLIKVYPSESSLSLFRNYDKELNIYFNKTGISHYFWIFNENTLLNDKIDQNLIYLNNLKRGIIRVYMTNSYDRYEYNSSNLKDNDHWVYDTCSSYSNEEDVKYDYSFSFCIKYYYNSNEKKYYSITDDLNFRWPVISQNQNSFENTSFATFIEICSNNSILNEILGDCSPEETINEYLYNFNNIFLSFTDSKIGIKEYKNHIEFYSHKIFDILNYKKSYFYSHELTFVPFNYKGSKGIISKKIEYNSFMLDNDRTDKIYNRNNNKLLLAYIFNSKKYINELRQKDNSTLELINGIGGSIFIIYIIFYLLNYFINERIAVRNFQWFLNDKNKDLIHRHINYERNKVFSFKSNAYSNLLHDLIYKNEGLNTVKSTYFGNFLKNDLATINNFTTNENNNSPKINTTNNYTIKINKIDNSEEKDGKKSDNIIVINNNSFMNDSNNKYISNNSLEKNNSLKLLSKSSNFDKLNNYHKAYTYSRSGESESVSKSVSKNKNINLNKTKIQKSRNSNVESLKSNRIDSSEYNSKHKMMDTSSITLLNTNSNANKLQNNVINNSYFNLRKSDPSLLRKDKEKEKEKEKEKDKEKGMESPNFFKRINAKINDSIKIFPLINKSSNRLSLNFNNLDLKSNLTIKKSSRKNTRLDKSTRIDKNTKIDKNTRIDKYTKIAKSSNMLLLDNKQNRSKSFQIINSNYKKVKEEIDKYKGHKAKMKKTGIFLNLPNNREDRNLSLFSKRSINQYNNSIYPNDKTSDNTSQIQISNNIDALNRRTFPLNNVVGKKIKKNQSTEYEIKRDKDSPLKNLNYHENFKFVRIVKNLKLTPKKILDYTCLCNHVSDIFILDNFRKKLLSEEYLYILHLNMFIFKQKYGCKSNLEQGHLLEEIYNDYN